jgi:hypothetical protein
MGINWKKLEDYSRGVFVWGGIGALQGIKGKELGLFAALGPWAEQLTGRKLEDAIVDMLNSGDNGSPVNQSPENFPPVVLEMKSPFTNNTKGETASSPVLVQYVKTVNDSKWLEMIPDPSVVVILGRRGSGKSALGHRLLELFRYRSLPFVLGIPQQALKYLPEWLGVVNSPEEAPDGSTLLIDEAYIRYSSRDSQKQTSRDMGHILFQSRHRNQTLIFVSQQARTIDKNIASTYDVLIIKNPEPGQAKFERREIKDIVELATERFSTIQKDKAKWSLVHSPACNFSDMLTSELPSYWNDRLSRMYAFPGPATVQKAAHKISKADKVKRAKMLWKMGMNITQITRDIGVRSRTTVYKYLNIPDENAQTN